MFFFFKLPINLEIRKYKMLLKKKSKIKKENKKGKKKWKIEILEKEINRNSIPYAISIHNSNKSKMQVKI